MEKATFGAGCFWGVEAAFRKIPGVLDTETGYAGGTVDHPTYERVLTNQTGHVEAVQITYDPKQVSYDTLLKVFWFVHDPTQGMRQGNDVGSQYRSVIFYHTDEQRQSAELSKTQLEKSGKYQSPITTTTEPITTFWSAEDYHQRYLEKNPTGYCHVPLGDVQTFINQLTKDKHAQ